VSDQPTLEEQIQQELQGGTGTLAPEVDADPLLTQELDAPPLVDVPPPLNMTLDPLQPGEDLPFPIGDGDGPQPSA
ncbi:hypothetical protein, partial [Deinococcus sp.]|uniref:hypothetical protein n=1 Tax=Deinococcus sp. TaxID=47478 RepID=UPI002869EAE6